MNRNEKRALDKCYASFIQDLDLTDVNLHGFHVDGTLTEQQYDELRHIQVREVKVATFLRYLPKRGPKAMASFIAMLAKDYDWLAKELSQQLQQIPDTEINLTLISVIQRHLIPLIYTDILPSHLIDEKNNLKEAIHKLRDMLKCLEGRCHEALGHTPLTGRHHGKTPLHILIKQKITSTSTITMDTEPTDLQKQVKEQKQEIVRLKKERDKLKADAERNKKKLKDYDKMARDSKRMLQLSHTLEMCRQENQILKDDIEILKKELIINNIV